MYTSEGVLVRDIATHFGLSHVAVGNYLRSLGKNTRANAQAECARLHNHGNLDIEVRKVVLDTVGIVDHEEHVRHVLATLTACADDSPMSYALVREVYLALGSTELVVQVCNMVKASEITETEIIDRLTVQLTGALKGALDASATM